MDAGWAAVIAGASGAGGAALAAWATGRAMVRQVRVQAEQGFDQWLRERRQESYASLLSAGDAVHDALNTVIGHTVTPVQPDEQRAAWRTVNAALREIDRTGRTVAVVGPPNVARKGLAMRAALYGVVAVWRDPTITAADQRAIAYATANRAWEESATLFLAVVEQVMQTFDGGRTA
ncbi:hypothetical protein [Streptomyces ureilyticus]|uniref:Uncharacterized protein n=1 Tax=Streptomyces ureilyticus TaxID=1775131 RepID=A0ABX0DIZ2_9ACTN|nr:hypothetical protein [Streptomyces ureilyticus]NGO40655.1 hypothetical protein [Streptomyces ureilyticus]